MKELCEFLSQDFTRVKIDFSSSNWQVQVKIPSGPGWYYVRTDTPFEILARQSLWARQYDRAKTGFRADVKNYDLRTRCARFAPGLPRIGTPNKCTPASPRIFKLGLANTRLPTRGRLALPWRGTRNSMNTTGLSTTPRSKPSCLIALAPTFYCCLESRYGVPAMVGRFFARNEADRSLSRL